MNKTLFWVLVVGIILVGVGIVVYLMVAIPDNAGYCLNNPIEYYQAKTGDSCWCQSMQNFFGDVGDK